MDHYIRHAHAFLSFQGAAAAEVLKCHFQSGLPYFTVFFALFWSYFHHRWAEEAIRFVLPTSAYVTLWKKRKADPVLNQMCTVNAVAMVHAAFTVPLAFLCFLPAGPLRDDKIGGRSPLVVALCWVMCGYFLWDVQTCVKQLKLYGLTFLLHGLLSFIGLYLQAATFKAPMFWYLTIFMASELSTPCLHIRWYLTKAGATGSRYFKLMNFLFLLLFVGYRLIFIEVYAFWPFLRLQSDSVPQRVHPYRWWFACVFIIVWCALNYYWGVLLLLSQWKHLWFQKPRNKSQ